MHKNPSTLTEFTDFTPLAKSVAAIHAARRPAQPFHTPINRCVISLCWAAKGLRCRDWRRVYSCTLLYTPHWPDSTCDHNTQNS